MSNGNCCDGLKEQLAALNSEVSRVKGEFQKLNEKLKETDNKINNLNNNINNIRGELNQLKQGKDNAELTGILIRLSKLESYCDSVEQVLENIAILIKPITAIFK